MNERIKDLALQAGIHFHKGGTLDAGPNGIAKFVLYSDMEKFAELIVRECAEYAEHNLDMAGYKKKFMLKHFGVEE
jgi:S-ribosylhomocysteine lyase LuxS involved in autoinducer biosynthesis